MRLHHPIAAAAFAVCLLASSGARASFEEGCFVSGAGHVGSDENNNGISDRPGAGKAFQDSFGGLALGYKDGTIGGHWQNTTHLQKGRNWFHGSVDFLYCWNDGGPGPDVPELSPNRAIFGGPGVWDGEPGYLFIASVADYKEGNDAKDVNRRDAYAISVYYDEDGDGVATLNDTIIYEESDCVYGNVQVHNVNQGHPYIPSPLTPEMDRVASDQDLCPGPDAPNW